MRTEWRAQVVEEYIGLDTCWEDLDRDGESSFDLHQIWLNIWYSSDVEEEDGHITHKVLVGRGHLDHY